VRGGNVTAADLSADQRYAVYRADAEEDEVFGLYSAPLREPKPGELKWQFFAGGREH